MKCKTTILVLAANPKDTPSLRLDEEVREIESGLLRTGRRGFQVCHAWAVRPRDVRRSLLQHRPSIVHFCGHGTGEEGLVLENDLGASQLVTNSALAGLFELFCQQVKCVVLNACFSESQAKAIASHIEYVVGMSRAIEDRVALEFAMGFYDAVAAGECFENAFRFGRNAIDLAGLHGNWIPILLKKIDQISHPNEEIQLPSPGFIGTTDTTRSSGDGLSAKTLKSLRDLGWPTLDIMKRLERLDYDNMAGLDAVSEGGIEQWTQIAESNPDGYAFIIDDRRQIVGYWHFEALPEELLVRLLRGETEDNEITIENITLLCAPGVVDIYFIAFVVQKEFRGFRANRLLLEAFFDRLEELAEAGIYVRKVCANAFTPEGVGLCKSMGMKYLQQHNRSGLIYGLDIRDSSVLLRARPRLAEILSRSLVLPRTA